MYTSSTEQLLFSLDERGIATITINRSEAMNALTWEIEEELSTVFRLSLIHISEPTRPY